MCGRFTQSYTWAEIHDLYRLAMMPASNLEPRWNIAPTEAIDIVLAEGEGHGLARARWGLVPGWWTKPLKDLPATFNARAETVAEKPIFRAAYKARRCVIPASGFYEWTGPKGARLPWFISGKDERPLSFAGLWETHRDPETGAEARSATIIVCEANAFMSRLHHRMPVILRPEEVDAWLAAPRPELLRPMPGDELQAWRVSPKVNSARYDGADATEPVAEA